VANVTFIDPLGPTPLAHEPIVVSDPQIPVYTSISRPGVLFICETVTVALPLLMASTVNHTLLFTVLSPHDKAGSEPTAVAPAVDEEIVLFAHNPTAFAQLLFCASEVNVIPIQQRKTVILNISILLKLLK
jgi:hypothetical protein